ncbi:MAG TPA: hypothetical protein PLY09_02560 [Methanothrix sp.]|nr:hypothetical protein [Methanothrix sp.]HPJ83624.1 hypothetical protein [Methanothrix sp.]
MMNAEVSIVPEVELRLLLAAQAEQIEALRDELATLREETARERAYDRQRISRLEKTRAKPTDSTHVEDLRQTMISLNIRQVSVKYAARLLELSKSRMDQLKPAIAADSRFQIVRDPRHKQRHLIRLVK